MRPLLRFQKSGISRSVQALLFVAAGFTFLPAAANADEPYRFRSGLQISSEAPFTRKQIRSLLKDLKSCTGFHDLDIDDTDLLSVGDRTKFTGGSVSARRLLVAALDSNHSFILESANYSPTIAFAEIEPAGIYIDAANRKHV